MLDAIIGDTAGFSLGNAKYNKAMKERIKIHDKLWKQATRKFFLCLANHYEGWWN